MGNLIRRCALGDRGGHRTRSIAKYISPDIVFGLVLVSIVIASAQVTLADSQVSPLDAGSLKSRVLITNDVQFLPTGLSYDMQDAQGKLSWYPRNTWLQQVDSLSTDPAPDESSSGFGDDPISFSWSNPDRQEQIKVTGAITTRNAIVPVRDRITFPLEYVDPQAQGYLGEEVIIDQSPEIKALAQHLAEGKNDEYEVVFSLADWTTRNVNYSLASLGQPAIQKSSQVLKSRYGKCDEMTALFISMNRALGIPARFVAGYAYSNFNGQDNGWGGHGWAEVWMPSQGWVPFDVTYGEYGYLDAGHVTLKFSPDAKENSIEYSARGNDFELRTSSLDISVVPLQASRATNDAISISLDAPYKTVGFGSSVLILATVQNNKDYYVSTRLDLAKTSSTEQLSSTYQNVLLRPKEKKTIAFLVKIDPDLQDGYMYEFPFKVYSRLGQSSTISISVKESAPYYDVSAYSMQLEQYSVLEKSMSFYVVCDQGKVAYVNTTITHSCSTNATALQVCGLQRFSGNTQKPDDGYDGCFVPKINDGKFYIDTKASSGGVSTSVFSAKDSAGEQIKFFVMQKSLEHTNLQARVSGPSKAGVDDLITVKVELNYSGAMPKNVNIGMNAGHASAEQKLGELTATPVLLFSVPARALRPGNNTIVASINYTDELGTSGTARATADINLTDVGILDRMSFFLEDVGYWIDGLFSR